MSAIRKAPRIPAPSQVVSKILSISRDPDCNLGAVADLIQRDGSLTAQLLRQANSAAYANAKTTSSVREACTRLGLKRVRSVAINDHVVSGLGKACPPGFKPSAYWQAALAASVAAQDLSRELMPQVADDAGTAGLLVDIGVGLLAYAVPTEYGPVLKKMEQGVNLDYRTLERSAVGTTHCEVAAAVLTDWKLDQRIVDAACGHHDVGGETSVTPESETKFTRLVAAAVTCAQIALYGPEMEVVERLFKHAEALHNRPDDLVSRLLDNLVAHVHKTAQDLAVEVGATDEMAGNINETIAAIPDFGKAMSCRSMDRAIFSS